MESNELGREVEEALDGLKNYVEDEASWFELKEAKELIKLLQAQQEQSRQSVTTISRLTADLQQANDRIKQLEDELPKVYGEGYDAGREDKPKMIVTGADFLKSDLIGMWKEDKKHKKGDGKK